MRYHISCLILVVIVMTVVTLDYGVWHDNGFNGNIICKFHEIKWFDIRRLTSNPSSNPLEIFDFLLDPLQFFRWKKFHPPLKKFIRSHLDWHSLNHCNLNDVDKWLIWFERKCIMYMVRCEWRAIKSEVWQLIWQEIWQ